MITKLALYLSENIFCSCDEFSAGEISASCFSTSFPPSIFDQLFSVSCFRRLVFDKFSWILPRKLDKATRILKFFGQSVISLSFFFWVQIFYDRVQVKISYFSTLCFIQRNRKTLQTFVLSLVGFLMKI